MLEKQQILDAAHEWMGNSQENIDPEIVCELVRLVQGVRHWTPVEIDPSIGSILIENLKLAEYHRCEEHTDYRIGTCDFPFIRRDRDARYYLFAFHTEIEE